MDLILNTCSPIVESMGEAVRSEGEAQVRLAASATEGLHQGPFSASGVQVRHSPGAREVAPGVHHEGRDAFRLPPVGVLTELSWAPGAARTTLAALWTAGLQEEGQAVAWVERCGSTLFPPDLAALGIDLAKLDVLRLPNKAAALDLGRGTELLLRTGAYGLIVVDLTDVDMEIRRLLGLTQDLRKLRALTQLWPMAMQSRLRALTRKHRTRLVLLTSTPATAMSLGVAVHLRIAPRCTRSGQLQLAVLKAKLSQHESQGPSADHASSRARTADSSAPEPPHRDRSLVMPWEA